MKRPERLLGNRSDKTRTSSKSIYLFRRQNFDNVTRCVEIPLNLETHRSLLPRVVVSIVIVAITEVVTVGVTVVVASFLQDEPEMRIAKVQVGTAKGWIFRIFLNHGRG